MRSERLTRSFVSDGRLCVRIMRSSRSTATALSLTSVTFYNSSNAIVLPSRACSRPRRASSWAPGIPSSRAVMLRASGSASSIAVDSNERASVPSCTCMRSASRASRAACSGSSVTFRRWAAAATGGVYYTTWHASCRSGKGPRTAQPASHTRSFSFPPNTIHRFLPPCRIGPANGAQRRDLGHRCIGVPPILARELSHRPFQ
jgi:hypothetical protein